MHTKSSLENDLKNMGLRPQDTVLMHSSMKAIGSVEGGADTVLDALCDYFAPGLVMLPALTWTVADMDDPVFDVRGTAAVVGLLPNLFMKRPGVVRSWHPTHSLAAFGADAAEVLREDHLNHTPCGPTSGWHKLMERDGMILMVGCGLTSCTFIHGVEEWNDVPNRLAPPKRFTVITPDGGRVEVTSSPHQGSPSEQYGRAEEALRRTGALRDGVLGSAHVLVLSARKTFETVSALLRENPHLFDKPRKD